MSQSRLALVLDSTDPDHIRAFINSVRGKDLVLKVGLKTLPQLPLEEWQRVAQTIDLFVDAKLHDIPDQVAGAVSVWSGIGAKYITLHCQGGPAMMETAVKHAGPHTRLLGVTVLTSLAAPDLARMGVKGSVEDYVSDLVRVSLESGLNSFVSSVLEVGAIRRVAGGKATYHVCPGISLGGHAGADQKRVVDLETALRERVDLLVMGRSLTESANFMDSLDKVLETIARV
ncbi:MAG TPA: orotidine-5'-phosphate decarboxylase [Bdellovibrionota bacterium]|nr:orotidine-5'-phosphate decarboxylase [Bdellovibrionota bacterium]